MGLDGDWDDGSGNGADGAECVAHFRPRHAELTFCDVGEFVHSLYADDAAALEQGLRLRGAWIGRKCGDQNVAIKKIARIRPHPELASSRSNLQSAGSVFRNARPRSSAR